MKHFAASSADTSCWARRRGARWIDAAGGEGEIPSGRRSKYRASHARRMLNLGPSEYNRDGRRGRDVFHPSHGRERPRWCPGLDVLPGATAPDTAFPSPPCCHVPRRRLTVQETDVCQRPQRATKPNHHTRASGGPRPTRREEPAEAGPRQRFRCSPPQHFSDVWHQARKQFHGGGGNRTRVRGRTVRTSTSVVRAWVSPDGRGRTPYRRASLSFGCRASGDWRSFGS